MTPYIFKIVFLLKKCFVYEVPSVQREIYSKVNSLTRVLYIVDSKSFNFDTFKSGCGNIHFELIESFKERYGDSNLSLFIIPELSDLRFVAKTIRSIILENDIDIVFGFPEAGPVGKWNWDHLVYDLKSYNIFFIGILLDSVHALHQFRINYLSFLSHLCHFIAIDNFSFNPKSVSGPVFLPISRNSLSKITSNLEIDQKILDSTSINFSGKMYDTRLEFISKIQEAGVPIQVNQFLNSSSRSSDNYLDYLNSMYSSRINLYLSKNSILDVVQLKTRALELSILGKPFISDSAKLIDIYFEENKHFFVFESLDELRQIYLNFLNIPIHDNQLSSIGMNLAKNDFWQLFERIKAFNS
jgi:hypothetical protein